MQQLPASGSLTTPHNQTLTPQERDILKALSKQAKTTTSSIARKLVRDNLRDVERLTKTEAGRLQLLQLLQ